MEVSDPRASREIHSAAERMALAATLDQCQMQADILYSHWLAERAKPRPDPQRLAELQRDMGIFQNILKSATEADIELNAGLEVILDG